MNVIRIINISEMYPDVELVNLEAMPKGLNARFLECSLSHHNPPKLIASQWRRKLPIASEKTNSIVFVDFENKYGREY